MLPPASVVETAEGRYLLFESADGISGELRARGRWDVMTLMFAKALVTIRRERGTIIDGGANVGAFTLPMAKAFQGKCRVVSFEIQRIVHYQLCGGAVLSGLDNVFAHNVGLGRRRERVALPAPDYAADPNIGGVSADPAIRRIRREAGRGCRTDREDAPSETAEVAPLDEYGIDDACLIKLDVEGMELPALQGADATIRRSGFPPLLLELWNVADLPALAGAQADLLAHVAALGYEVTTLGELVIAQHRSQPSYLDIAVNPDGRGVTAKQRTRGA